MGDPNDPIVYGNNCALCFSAGETPAVMAITFSGIQKQPLLDDYNGTYLCVQTAGDSCWWRFDKTVGTEIIIATLAYSGVHSGCSLIIFTVLQIFSASIPLLCATEFDNDLVDPLLPYYGGTAHVEGVNPQSMRNYQGGLYPVSRAKLETLTDEPDRQVIRTVDTIGKTNFKILTDGS